MNKILMLVKREFWEHRISFLYLPVCILAFCAVLIVIGLIQSNNNGLDQIFMSGNIDSSGFGDRDFDVDNSIAMISLESFANNSSERKAEILNNIYLGISAPLGICFWLAVISYLLASLYQDRKDRSILFWKSMPVSDELTIASKLAAVLILAPLIYLACLIILHIFMLISITIYALGSNIEIWSSLWAPANMITRWFQILGFWLVVVLWTLPFLSWLMFVSSWAKSTPFAWALGIPVGIMLAESALTESATVKNFIGEHISPSEMLRTTDSIGLNLSAVVSNITSLEFVISTLLGLGFIYGAIYFRRRADEL